MKLHCLNVTADGEPTAISPWPKISAVFSMPLSMSLTSFSEYKDTKPRKTPVWFALNKDRPLAAFAGIWRPWTGVRGTKAEPVEGEHLLYSFLTSEPNGVVGPIHPKAMLVILTTPEDYETWLTAPADVALKLQRPLPDDMLDIVAEGARSDQPEDGQAAGSRA